MSRLYLLSLGLLATTARAQAPVLTARIPAANAPAASRNAPLQLTFDRPMSAQAATPDAIRVVSPWRGRLPGSYAGAGTSTISFTPQPALLPGEAVQVSVTARATSLAGTAPAAPSVYQFTAAAPTGTGRFPGFEHEDLVPGLSTGIAPVLADINQDGNLDLLAASTNVVSPELQVRLGNGQGGFTAAPSVALGQSSSLAVGDVNEDGHPDVLSSSQLPGLVRVRLGNGQGGFTAAADVTMPSYLEPSQVVLGDVNNDGHLDLLTANSFFSYVAPSANSVSVRLGNGQGGFSGSTNVPVGGVPVALALGDVNGDGNLDFVTADSQSNSVSVRLGNGQGGFGGNQYASVGTQPVKVRLGDLNGDGHLDLVTVNQLSSNVSVRLGNGAGAFSGTTELAMSFNPQDVTLADLNRDGRLDLLTAIFSSGVDVRLGTGQGGFGPGTIVPGFEASPAVRGLAVGDVNGDTYPDLAMATNYQVALRLNNGQGSIETLPLGPRVPVGYNARRPTLADLNGDGNLDLLAAYDQYPTTANPNPPGLVSVRLGNGLAGFGGTLELPVGVAPSGLTVGDVNEDGYPDLLVPNLNLGTYNQYDGVTVAVRLGNGQGGFTNGPDAAVKAGPKQVVLADVNGDGHLDMVVPNSFTTFNGNVNGTVSIRLGDGMGNFSGSTEVDVGAGSIRAANWVAVADVNNDGKLDLLASIVQPGSVSVRLGDGKGFFSGTTEIPVGTLPQALTTGDVNEDGNVDLLTVNSNTTGAGTYSVSVRLGNGQGGFAAAADVPNIGSGRTIALADLNADGHLDLLVGTSQFNSLYLAGLNVMPGTGQGTFGPARLLRTYDQFAVGDVDRDGDLDVVATIGYNQRELGVRLNGGGTGAVLATQGGLSPRPAGPQLTVYPNPAHHEIRLSGATTREALQLLSSQGRLLRQLPAGTTTLDVRALPAGLYLLRQGPAATRFIVE